AVDIGAVGRNVVEPIAPVTKANFAMLAGNGAARIRKGPIEMGVTAHVEPPSLHFDPQRPPIRQSIDIFNPQTKSHILAQNRGCTEGDLFRPSHARARRNVEASASRDAAEP